MTRGTLEKYRRAVRGFVEWCRDRGLDARDDEELDELLNEYLHELFFEGKGKALASCTLYGMRLYEPRLKGRLPVSEAALRGFERALPSRPYLPMPWELTVAVAVRLAGDGRWRMAIGVLLAFDCLLRINELLALRREDLPEHAGGMVVVLKATKTGANQSVVVRRPHVRVLVSLLLADTAPGAKVFPFSAATFRSTFQRCVKRLGVSEHFVPHSLRHGGATRMFLDGDDIKTIMHRGRWLSLKSVTRYVQSCRAALLELRLRPDLMEAGCGLARDVCGAMAFALRRCLERSA